MPKVKNKRPIRVQPQRLSSIDTVHTDVSRKLNSITLDINKRLRQLELTRTQYQVSLLPGALASVCAAELMLKSACSMLDRMRS